jgi:hypothetical protein
MGSASLPAIGACVVMMRAYARRLRRLEAPYKCPRHHTWLQCGCEESDPDRLTTAERQLVNQLLDKAGYVPTLSATPYPRYGEAMLCTPCETPVWLAALEQLGPEEQQILADLGEKMLVSPTRAAAGLSG